MKKGAAGRRASGKVGRASRGSPRARTRRLSATAAARGFSDLLNRVEYRGETILIERNGHTVCTIAPATPSTCTAVELWEVLKTIPRADPKFADDLERITRQARVARSPWER